MSPDPTRRDVLRGSALAAGAALFATSANAGAESGQDGTEGASVRATLAALLARNRGRSPEYGGGLSNHMSMALGALADLGASAQRLEEFDARHARRLEPFPAGRPPLAPEAWREAIGHPEAFAGLVPMFEGALREQGRDAVLRDALPALLPGIGGAAFHGLIRTAYAVRADEDAEIAHGLAYWAARAALLGEIAPEPGAEADPRALLERVQADEKLANRRIDGGTIIDRMRKAAALPGFAEAANALDAKPDTLDRLALAMLDVYATTHDFTALHAVTSTHALRVLMPFVADPALAVRCHWQALAAAYIVIGAPKPATLVPAEPPAWEAISARAVASEDEHTIKLVDTCRQEQLARGGDAYALVAGSRVGL